MPRLFLYAAMPASRVRLAASSRHPRTETTPAGSNQTRLHPAFRHTLPEGEGVGFDYSDGLLEANPEPALEAVCPVAVFVLVADAVAGREVAVPILASALSLRAKATPAIA